MHHIGLEWLVYPELSCRDVFAVKKAKDLTLHVKVSESVCFGRISLTMKKDQIKQIIFHLKKDFP